MSAPSLRFIETTQTSFERKRKHLYRACEDCRKKKKRCFHTLENVESEAQCPASGEAPIGKNKLAQSPAALTPPPSWGMLEPHPFTVSASSDGPVVVTACDDYRAFSVISSEDDGGRATAVHADSTQAHGARFIGDMNPEGVFFATADTEVRQKVSTRGSIGVWLAEHGGQPSRLADRCTVPLPRPSLFRGFRPAIRRAIMPILEEECLSTIPPVAHRNALRAAYFEKFHPLLPVVNKSTFQSLPSQGLSRLLLDQGMCLVASMDSSLRHHLYLSDGSAVLSCKDFGHRLLATMRTSIEIGWVTEKVLLVQLLALMSLFQEGPDGCENSLLTLGRAVQHLHSLGFHLRMEVENTHWDHAGTLFCCVWLLDRLSAASQGRPVLMHERDISRSMQQCFDAQDPSFRLVLRIGTLLDEVVTLYRPDCADTRFAHDFVLFEDLAVECQATALPPHLLATIEVFYHAVAILSCHPISDGSDHQVSSSRRTRQFWSAERATALVGHEFHDQLVPLPFIPYAVSLSLSVSYRELRRNRIPTHRARARNGMEVNCRILKELGRISGSAATMARTGSMTLKELDRVCTSVKDDEQRRMFDDHSERHAESVQEQVPAAMSACTDTEAALTIPHDFDVYYFSDMPGLDPFDMFDPNFNLESVDTFLEGHLDPAQDDARDRDDRNTAGSLRNPPLCVTVGVATDPHGADNSTSGKSEQSELPDTGSARHFEKEGRN
ncbi:hypothetical protein SVAN01_11560 [Stagonosporopsis vannaccii]|nr:hypothetical protein SVAN01_11560 [Stagonosporopsis vannaccii]